MNHETDSTPKPGAAGELETAAEKTAEQRGRPAPAPAPAPAPPPPQQAELARKTQGFNPKGRRVLLEFGLIAVVLAALGALAFWGGGSLAAALAPLVPNSVDRKLGELGNTTLVASDCSNPEAKKYIEELAQPLMDAAGPLPFRFQFRVVDDPSVNAFALPGGFVTVNFGLLQAAKSGEEVAGVLGHEIQHALLRHGTRRMLREMGAATVLSLIFGASELKSYAALASRLTSLRYDRAEESEADKAGVQLLVRAGIDPAGLVTFFERLSEKGLTPPELLSTHPDPGNRAAEVRAAKLQVPKRTLRAPSELRCSR